MELEGIFLSQSQTQKDKHGIFSSYIVVSRLKNKKHISRRRTIWEEEGDQ
jgi:hypothetical protein